AAGGRGPGPARAERRLAQLRIVVDLPVEGQQVAPAFIRQRLVAGGDVDDRQALVPEHRVGAHPVRRLDELHPGLVRAPVMQALQGGGDRVPVGVGGAGCAEVGEESTHGPHPRTPARAAGGVRWEPWPSRPAVPGRPPVPSRATVPTVPSGTTAPSRPTVRAGPRTTRSTPRSCSSSCGPAGGTPRWP